MTEINPDSKSQNVAQQLEPALPIPIPEVLSGDERHECECGKTILKKNVNAHLKTAAHLKATAKPNAENLAPIEDNTNEPVVRLAESIVAPQLKKDAAFKIKSEFDIIQSKLDLLLEMVADVHAAEFESDDEDEEAANN